MWGFSGLAEELFTSQEGLCFFGVVSENLKWNCGRCYNPKFDSTAGRNNYGCIKGI
jgi:hypothetical protein